MKDKRPSIQIVTLVYSHIFFCVPKITLLFIIYTKVCTHNSIENRRKKLNVFMRIIKSRKKKT